MKNFKDFVSESSGEVYTAVVINQEISGKKVNSIKDLKGLDIGFSKTSKNQNDIMDIVNKMNMQMAKADKKAGKQWVMAKSKDGVFTGK